LMARGHTVRCLVREGSEDRLPLDEGAYTVVDSSKDQIVAGAAPTPAGASGVEVVYGDVTDVESIEGDMAGCDAVIHLVGIIEEQRHKGITFEHIHVRGTRSVVEQARAASVPRFVHMSANGAREDADASDYHTTKWQAEEIVRQAGFDGAVIFRPSIVFGDPGEGRPEFASRLADTLVRGFPILPVLGDGQYELQPVHVLDVARAFADAVEMPLEAGEARSYCLGGPEALSFDTALDRIAEGMGGRPKPKAHVPLGIARAMVGTVGAMGLMPISPAQFRMLIEGNTCDIEDFRRDFEPALTPFTPENLAYLK
jgi:nucleoside-diphosphate-sugar epimerase